MRYLLYTETKGGHVTAAIVDVPRRYSSDDYGNLQDEFEKAHGGRYTGMIRFETQEEFGVPYDWGLQGPGGAWFLLLRFPTTTEQELREAKHRIRAKRDVVSMRTLHVHKLVDWPLAQ